jgi:type II secretory pathway pseudopilin PulG
MEALRNLVRRSLACCVHATFARGRTIAPRVRRGITLLEVLISIGVVGIGLLGVASLIPLAHYKATQGIEEDRKSQFGKRAFRDFFVLGIDRPGSVQASTGGMLLNPYWTYAPTPGINPYELIFNLNTGKVLRKTYCIDPLYVASPGPNGEPYRLNARFPADTSALPADIANSMPLRLTLLSRRPEDYRLQLNPAQRATYNNFLLAGNGPNLLMSLPQAEQVFRLQDDVVVEAPQNPNDIARQSYLDNGMKGYTGGAYSWMATLVPDDLLTGVGTPATNMFTLSVVVFHQRSLAPFPRQEVIAQVVNLTGPNGQLLPPSVPDQPISVLAGNTKEVVIQQVPFATPNQGDANVGDIRAGGWVALLQGGTNYLKWYRVQAVDQPDNELDTTRALTLVGPDWHSIVPNPAPPLFAIFVKNVVAVYDKTVELR